MASDPRIQLPGSLPLRAGDQPQVHRGERNSYESPEAAGATIAQISESFAALEDTVGSRGGWQVFVPVCTNWRNTINRPTYECPPIIRAKLVAPSGIPVQARAAKC